MAKATKPRAADATRAIVASGFKTELQELITSHLQAMQAVCYDVGNWISSFATASSETLRETHFASKHEQNDRAEPYKLK